MASTTPDTAFTHDVYGRYICNSFAEAVASGPFDAVIVGGGTFGLTLAQDLFVRSQNGQFSPDNFRILVLEAGPFVLAQHMQDVPRLGLKMPVPAPDSQAPPPPEPGQPLPATRQQLIGIEVPGQPLMEVWGLPWNSQTRFGGMAYCLGGRSLFFGGWSPQHLATEMHTKPVGAITADTLWPQTVVDDLTQRFFDEAAEQTGVTASNDFLDGDLQQYFRDRIAAVHPGLTHAVAVQDLPDHPAGAHANDPNLLFDAPLAVQNRTRPGFFPFAKFSSVPLAISAARGAYSESPNDDSRKRLMIVPNCHVRALQTRPYVLATGATVNEVVGVDTTLGYLDLSKPIAGNVNRRPVVVLAMGAIESARMALVSQVGGPGPARIGTNLMVHLRKNVTLRIGIPAGLNLTEQEVAALLVRFRAVLSDGVTPVHFHLQITASAVPLGSSGDPDKSEALLFQSVPDLDTMSTFSAAPGRIDVAIRAVGEMLPNPAGNTVTLDQDPTQVDFGTRRAWVNINRSAADIEVMTLMDKAIDEVATKVFGVAAPPRPPDGLGTTFHESGTLRMGDDPARSVTDADGRFHHVSNLYAGDAAVLPTCGSSSPVMNGIAMRRRLARRLVPAGDLYLSPRPVVRTTTPAPWVKDLEYPLFDGSGLAHWRTAGWGTFHMVDGALQSVPGSDLGLLWYDIPTPSSYRLELEFLQSAAFTNSGVFVRFTHPDATVYANPAWRAVHTGFEVQIDNLGAPSGGRPPGLPKFRTGVVYDVNYPGEQPAETTAGVPAATPGDLAAPQNALINAWNQLAIEVDGTAAPAPDRITVTLNGNPTCRYTIPQGGFQAPYTPDRGQFVAGDTYVGLQSYSNYSYTTAFRNISLTPLV